MLKGCLDSLQRTNTQSVSRIPFVSQALDKCFENVCEVGFFEAQSMLGFMEAY
jgi:hypothetical protein